MGAGDLNQPITFEQPSHTPDGYGGTVLTWTQVGNRTFASIRPINGAAPETERQGTLRASSTYSLKLLRRRDIDETMRIRWDGEILNIRNINRGATRELTMTIIAEGGVTQ